MGTLTKELKIDKEVLEANVVTATSKNNDVFEMLAPFIEEIAESIKDNVLGEPAIRPSPATTPCCSSPSAWSAERLSRRISHRSTWY